jgi:hypothetical protein
MLMRQNIMGVGNKSQGQSPYCTQEKESNIEVPRTDTAPRDMPPVVTFSS